MVKVDFPQSWNELTEFIHSALDSTINRLPELHGGSQGALYADLLYFLEILKAVL